MQVEGPKRKKDESDDFIDVETLDANEMDEFSANLMGKCSSGREIIEQSEQLENHQGPANPYKKGKFHDGDNIPPNSKARMQERHSEKGAEDQISYYQKDFQTNLMKPPHDPEYCLKIKELHLNFMNAPYVILSSIFKNVASSRTYQGLSS